MIPHDKLFTPGPVEVSAKTLAAFARPTIGHRGDDFKNLYRDIHSNLQVLFGTKQPVFLSTSSSWGVMEGAIRNLVVKGVLCCMCGAFSDKWLDVARRCGKNAEPLQVDWGKHIDHKDVDLALASGKFDTITSVAAMKIEMDALGIDVMLTGAQKALALPPGFSLFSVSEKAFARAEKIDNRGYYFDFLEFKKQQAEGMPPTTRSFGHIFAFKPKLEKILKEGFDARHARHARTNALVHDW